MQALSDVSQFIAIALGDVWGWPQPAHDHGETAQLRATEFYKNFPYQSGLFGSQAVNSNKSAPYSFKKYLHI